MATTKDESDRKYHLSVFEAIMKTLPREPPKNAISSLPAPSSSEEEDEEDEEEDEEEEEEEEEEKEVEEEEEEEEEVEDEDKDEEEEEYLTLEHTPAPDDYIWPSDLYILLNRKAVRDTLKMYRRLDAENKVPADLWQTPTSIIKRMKNSGELPEEKLMEYCYTDCFPYLTPFQWLRIVRSKDGEFMLEDGPRYCYRYSQWDIVKCQQYVNLADELLEIKFDPLKMNGDNEDKLGIVECIARKKKLDQLLDFDIETCVEDIMHIRHEENFLPEILGLYEHLAEYKMKVQKLTRNQEFNLSKGLQSMFHHLGESLIKDVINVSFVEGLKPEEVKDLGKKRVQMYESMPKSSFNTILEYVRYKLARASELGVIYRNSEGIYVNNLRIPC